MLSSFSHFSSPFPSQSIIIERSKTSRFQRVVVCIYTSISTSPFFRQQQLLLTSDFWGHDLVGISNYLLYYLVMNRIPENLGLELSFVSAVEKIEMGFGAVWEWETPLGDVVKKIFEIICHKLWRRRQYPNLTLFLSFSNYFPFWVWSKSQAKKLVKWNEF